SFSNTGDFILIGKSKVDMMSAFNRINEIGGGISLVEDGEVISEIQLPLMGKMSDLPLEELITKEKQMIQELEDRGYSYKDPVYS
ncbi:adenine deaminase C-terminal domain-containing protein, partial [Planococcus sp. SIMBA_143]